MASVSAAAPALLAICALLLTTAALLQWAFQSWTLTAGYTGATLLLTALAGAGSYRKDRWQRRADLQPDRAVLLLAFNGTANPVAITDRAGRMICANAAHEDAFGAAGLLHSAQGDDEGPTRIDEALRTALLHGQAFGTVSDCNGGEWALDLRSGGRSNGFVIWSFSQQAPAKGAGAGEPLTLEHAQRLLATLPIGLALLDRHGSILFANLSFRQAVHGEAADGDLPSSAVALVVPEDRGALQEAISQSGGRSGAAALSIRLAATAEQPLTMGVTALDGVGDAAVLLSLKDAAEEARLKRQIGQATKMQAVGQLAGGVAHDFNNVLTAILGYCDLMSQRHTPGDSDYEDLAMIKSNANRAASLTRQLLAFSRQQTLRPQIVQLPEVLSEVSAMLKRLIGADIRLEVRHQLGLGPVRADPQQLEQVIINLAVNARDAIAEKGGEGRLTISTRRMSPTDVRRMDNDILPPAEYTALVVEDTGTGIAPDRLGKIFEPFYTTKELGKGTGLGLSTVYGIVKQSGGFIFADNHAEGGARFSVYLPVYNALPGDDMGSAPDVASKEPKRRYGGTGRILLVEDEDMVRTVAQRSLTRLGYAVTTAADGEEGLRCIEQQEPFDLVISDVVMPNLNGPAMMQAIRERYPDLPVIFMSGYAEEQLRREIDIARMYFLAKPFTMTDIGTKVATLLEPQPAPD
ncbi:response regulator [Croceicoccus sp. F390]|uniref:histidine kinase n=1 Tax=Croceicoccus esteveae TaxID=3075597 RepID=A0ABU2ZE22_9SPHN|nr:response regulator [Croceicoccus sp. F390]MDT0574850.1 response regulator [Croceicoccus sp. F390]